MKKYIDAGKVDTRSGFGAGLVIAGRENENVLALTADLKGSLKMGDFAKEFPERFIQCGIAESNMVGVAAGLAITGKVPFIGSFAEFVTGRVYDQLRQEVAYGHTNVKIASSHAGITLGEDGATHQCNEDLALMRTIPGMVVMCPSDDVEARAAVRAAIEHDGPVYIRFGRAAVPVINDENYKFELGKGVTMREGKDVTIIATGLMVARALDAAKILEEKGISTRVVNIHTIKPLDKDLVIAAAKETGKVVTAEEHSVIGGLGSAVSEFLAEEYPVPVIRLGVNDTFGKSGPALELLKIYGLDAENIVAKAKIALAASSCF